jgi:hypothetical protein
VSCKYSAWVVGWSRVSSDRTLFEHSNRRPESVTLSPIIYGYLLLQYLITTSEEYLVVEGQLNLKTFVTTKTKSGRTTYSLNKS